MSFITILLIIGFINPIQSLSKSSTDVIASLYNVSLFRHKRAHTEYTRWRPNQLSTEEFIVKVLDDDIPTTTAKEVVAVNILATRRDEPKIIVGGAVVPSPTPQFPDVGVSVSRKSTYSPKAHIRNDPPFPQYKYGVLPQRDESPPAGPQFVARPPSLLSRQYAPITPVVFTQRSPATYLTPPIVDRRTPPGTWMKPSRTAPFPDVEEPSRTSIFDNEFVNFHPFEDEDMKSNPVYVSRSSYLPSTVPERTTPQYNIYNVDETTIVDTPTLTTEGAPKTTEKVDEDKEFDPTYGMMFYSEEDNENSKLEHKAYKDEPEPQANETHDETTFTTELIRNVSIENLEHQEPDISSELEIEFQNATNIVSNITQTDTEFAVEILEAPIILKHNCSLLQLRPLNFKSPRTLPEIVMQLKRWAETSPVAKIADITSGNYTLMENPIYMMIIDDPSSGQIISAKQTVMVIAGIQGRDHQAVSAALYVLYQLIERTEEHSDLLSKYRFWIVPVFNPDGYDYSITFPQRREWTKNLRQTWETGSAKSLCGSFGLRCSIKPCYGVNLDRNFEYQWIPPEELRAEHPCGELYAGARQLSEAETLALTRYLHAQRVPLHTFVAFKEGDVLGIMYPYSHTKKSRAFDHIYRQRASRAASAAYGISGRPYVAGQTSQFLPLYAGGIEDWVDGHLGIDNTYTVMMFRPTDSFNSKYVTERVVHEAYAALDTLLLHSMEPALSAPVVTLSRSKGTLHKLPHPAASALCTSILTILTGVTILIRI
ncbi:PREDICTED: uncharacterized protein LOC106118866 [Papilio xuthus]|uniref:Uncharacterized protein LOC106118866 n=1 Tax=Papilio xuthus TaxID=66420 RepID=A0AAJ6ZBI1_PAPXU|nr:PREDICTED: uncharacterized protein LOC106118866 [Papilio xuthus]